MSRRRFFERLDDWMNPIVVKELRQAVLSKLVVAALMLFLFIQILILATMLLGSEARMGSGAISFNAGRRLFMVLQGLMLGTCMLVPAYVGGRLGAERSDTHSDLMFISTLKPRSIVAGKFLSGVVLVLLIFSACTPFMTFTYLLRGIDIPTILLIVAMDFVLALWGIAGVIFLAVIPAPRPVKGALGLAGFFALLGLFSMGMSLTEGMVSFGFFLDTESWRFWGPMLLVLAIIIGQSCLFFTWSSAILSPASANKAVLMRLVMLAYVAGIGVASYILCDVLNDYSPLAAWLTIASVLSSLQLFISVNEREHLGLRVKRTIPRSPLLRLPAFLLYSGSAGGVIFSVMMLLGTIATALLILAIRGDLQSLSHMGSGRFGRSGSGSGWGGAGEMLEFLRFVVLLGIYTYCFCMTAVFVRRVLLRTQMRHNFTWLIVLLLVGLGSTGPYLIKYFVSPNQGYYYDYDSPQFWLLTNPFVTIGHAVGRYDAMGSDIFDMYCMPLLLLWAGLVSLINLSWLFGQLKRFAPPPRPRPVEKPQLVLAESPTT